MYQQEHVILSKSGALYAPDESKDPEEAGIILTPSGSRENPAF